jgi:nucleoside-diphosphate-sugar epimerase
VYGPLDVEDRVVSKFLLGAIRGNILQVKGHKEQLDFTCVTDAAIGIADAAVSEDTYNTTYNITRGQSRTLLEAAELAVSIAGQGSIEVLFADDKFPSRGQLNTQRAHLDFGYTPTVDIEQGFQEYYDWLIDNPIYRAT